MTRVGSPEELRERLEGLATSIDRLPVLANPPKTTLGILGETRTEAYWEGFLEYFLDPAAPHGFGTDVLEAFLTAVSNHSACALTPRAYQLSDVNIDSQVGADDGVPDILLWVADEWFCCIELKAHSGESDDQTIRYAESTSLGSLRVADFPQQNRHYLYLAPSSNSDPASEAFARLHWEDVIPFLSDVLATGRGRYPSKSRAQLADFIDTLEDELAMTDYKRYEREKVELAIEYGAEITDVQSALQEFVEQEQNSWPDDFMIAAPDGWDTDQTGQLYPRLYNREWLFARNGGVETTDEAGLALEYVSKIDEQTLLQGDLSIEFKRRSGCDEELKNRAYDALYSDEFQSRLRELAADHDLTLFDRRDGAQVFETSVELDIGRGDTIGGQFAQRIRELQPVNELISRTLSEIEWESA